MQQRGPLIESLHLFVLAGFAIAQPIYALLKRDAAFFVTRRSEPVDLWVLALVLSFAVPALLVAGVAVARRLHRTTGIACQRVVAGLLVSLTVLPVVERAPLPSGAVSFAGALAIGTAATWLYHRSRAVGTFLTYLTPTIVLFPAVFLLDPSIAKILRNRSQAAHEVAGSASPSITPVVVVVLDALPLLSLLDSSDRIDPVRFPHFARLAATATWYRNASAVSDDTTKAVPAVFTGSYPNGSLLPSYLDHPRTLFSLLGDGYAFEVSEPVTDLCPPRFCDRTTSGLAERMRSLASDVAIAYLHIALPDAWTAALPDISQAWQGFASDQAPPAGSTDDVRIERFGRFLETIRGSQPATLYAYHALLPHTPYALFPSGLRYTIKRQSIDGEGLQWGRWSDDTWAIRSHHRRHLLQVGTVDTLLGRLFDRLQSEGLFDASMIVVTADHGVSFRPGEDRRRASRSNLLDIMSVPLLIKRPGQKAGEVDDRNIETIDILPTIADLLGTELTWPIDGRSAVDTRTPRRSEKTCFGERPFSMPASAFRSERAALAKAEAPAPGTFGDLFRMGPHPELMGQSVESLPIEPSDGSVRASLLEPGALERVDPASGFVPALIEGLAELSAGSARPVALAVGVDGTIRATTQTFVRPVRDDLFTWSALLEEGVLDAGAHAVDLLWMRETASGLRFQHVGGDDLAASFLGVRLAVEPVPIVRENGFYPTEKTADGRPYRWTTGKARLVVPVTLERPPTTLRVDLIGFTPGPVDLLITVGQQPIFQGTVPHGDWTKTLDLSGVRIGQRAAIELTSDTFVPNDRNGSADHRTLGVAVAGIWLDD